MVTVARGDIVLCDLNPVIGTEQSGIRPVVTE
ncbi:type II toxin-antitoxin system PemK/MazF family toxin [Tumidithrix helvetica]